MLGLSGQLGIGALGNFRLASVRVGQPFVPHRGRARSALDAPGISASLYIVRGSSELTSPGIRSSLSTPGVRSSISGRGFESEVSDG